MRASADWQQTLERLRQNPDELAKRVQILPVLDGGKLTGVRVSAGTDTALMNQLRLRHRRRRHGGERRAGRFARARPADHRISTQGGERACHRDARRQAHRNHDQPEVNVHVPERTRQYRLSR